LCETEESVLEGVVRILLRRREFGERKSYSGAQGQSAGGGLGQSHKKPEIIVENKTET